MTAPSAIISPVIRPRISMLLTRTRRKNWTSDFRSTKTCSAVKPARDLAAKIDRGRAEAMQVAAHFPFDQRGAADHAAAAQIPFRGEMNFAVGANRAAEARRDLVIAQVDVLAALRANRRGRGGTDFLRGLAIETFDDRAGGACSKAFEFLENDVIGCDSRPASSFGRSRTSSFGAERQQNARRIGGTSCSWPRHTPSA